jgi:hypothetical protein
MPGPAIIPLIIGGGARLLAGQAIKQGTKQGAKTVAKKTAKPRTTKKTTAKKTTAKKTTAKKTAAPRKPAQKDVLTRGEQAQKRAEQAASRARKKGDIKGSMKSSAEAAKRGAADTKRARLAKNRRDKAQKRPGRIAAGTAAGVGFGGAAGGVVITKAGQKPKPKRFRK